MSVAIALLAVVAITAPHLLRLDSAYPATAATIWLSAICLRALVVLFAAIYVIFYLPATELFSLVTHWCWDTLPTLTGELGIDGHRIGDAALLAPLLGVSASLAWVCFGLWRAARAVSRWIRRRTIGPGPQHSVIVGEHDVLVAAAGLRHPRVIVSAGAVTTFDDDELAASLAHEHGHIARFHRVALLTAEIARALARFLPGTRHAINELLFQLERDADHWALRQRHDPAALASAICKATARPRLGQHTSLLTLRGGGVTQRVRQLLAPAPGVPTRRTRLDLVAVAMTILVAALTAALPAASVAGAAQNSHSTH
ncbi:MAG: M56 family metallopeptidase, partial [Actinobacteria bacterium]|nr:M56 family metallopeptidase [Actinomycetota bacterium]